ncbi:MAG: hypothetical protein RLZZ301_462 [Bacteroidota bacterium]
MFVSSCSLVAQIQGNGGVPKSLKAQFDAKTIDTHFYPSPDIAALQAEDALTDRSGNAPWRFGYNQYTNVSTSAAGTWHTLANGDRLWQVKLVCENALTINLTFENTTIPAGNLLYAFNPSKDFILGAFTQEHIYEGQLGTELIPGTTAVLEYYVPKGNPVGNVQVAIVTHGYRSANEFMEKAFGSSGACNHNVNCPEGANWQNQRNGVVMLVSGSSGFCSGSLVNNTQNNGKPYVLTANHCYSNPATWIFRFNWQGTDCPNPTASPSFQSLSGAVLRARDTPSDFCLVEITGGLQAGSVPTTFTPYFNGWDNSGSTPQMGCGIHHPSGDIKKISFENDPLISTTFGTCPANSHWGVTNWDTGVTEGGSSGSPLFDQNHHIIGQLHGGASACGAASLSDEYGKFSWSWNPAGTDSTKQLKYWLDPSNSGAVFIDGFDPLNATPVALDASISAPSLVPVSVCATDYTPTFTILNNGTSILSSATITYVLDGGAPQTMNWNGSLSQWQSQVVTLANVSLTPGAHTFQASVSNPNAGTDENPANDAASNSITVAAIAETAGMLKVSLLTDNYADETYMELSDANGVVVWSEGNENVAGNFGTGNTPAPTDNTNPLSNNTAYTYDIPLTSFDCYTFTIYDYYGDGMGAQQWGGTDGSLSLSNHLNALLYTLPAPDFGASTSYTFKNVSDASVLELNNSWKLYPNPSNGFINIEWMHPTAVQLSILDIYGKQLEQHSLASKQVQLDVSSLSAGTYFVRVISENGAVSMRQFIKK